MIIGYISIALSCIIFIFCIYTFYENIRAVDIFLKKTHLTIEENRTFYGAKLLVYYFVALSLLLLGSVLTQIAWLYESSGVHQ